VQKINSKASILIWAIFLSLIVSVSFISISTKITKNLKNSFNINSNLEKQNKINNILKKSENNTETIWNTTIYIENKTLKKSLKKGEIYTIKFPVSSNITLKLTNSWIIKYKFNSDIWIFNNTNSEINLNWSWDLILENFAWYSSFELTSDNKFDIIEKKYKIIEKTWNKEVIKSFWKIK